MAYVPVPKDLTHVRQKVLFNLIRRQLVCFLGGALVGAPLFYLLKPYVASSAASLVMVLVMTPFILLGVYEKNGEPLVQLIMDRGELTAPLPKIEQIRQTCRRDMEQLPPALRQLAKSEYPVIIN